MKKLFSLLLSISVIISTLFINTASVYAVTYVTVNNSYSATVTSNSYTYFYFTPVVSGNYTVYSIGSVDSFLEVRDTSNSTLYGSNDDGGDDRNFSLTYYFTQGNTYRLNCKCYGSNTGTYSVTVINAFEKFTTSSGSCNVNIAIAGERNAFSFTPVSSGVYRFYSYDSSNLDTKVWLYDSNLNQIEYNDDSGADNNFSLSYYMTSGTEYIIAPGYYNSTSIGSFTMYFEKLSPETLGVSDSKDFYYIGDSFNKNTLTVTAYYPTYYEDSPYRILQSWSYDVEFDSSKSGTNVPLKATLINSDISGTTFVNVVKPTLYASGGGYDYYNTDDSYLLSSIENTVTATTNPSNVKVSWECSDSSVLQITSTDDKSANIYVLKPSETPITITASYTYNSIKYSCSFLAEIPFEVQNASLATKKTSYYYGEAFTREKVKATIVNASGSKTGTFSVLGTLPSTKKTPGKYTRSLMFYGQNFSYTYTIKCATPKISSVKPVSSTSQKVTWSKAGGAKGYYVYRATSKTGTYKKIATTTSTSITSSKLSANKTYYYKVKAYYNTNSAYNSAYSAIVSGKTKLSTPSSVKAKAGTKKVTVSWKKVSGAKGYYVYRATSKNGKYTKIKTTSNTSYTNSKLKSKKTYYYKVVAYSSNSSYNSAYSKAVSAKTK